MNREKLNEIIEEIKSSWFEILLDNNLEYFYNKGVSNSTKRFKQYSLIDIETVLKYKIQKYDFDKPEICELYTSLINLYEIKLKEFNNILTSKSLLKGMPEYMIHELNDEIKMSEKMSRYLIAELELWQEGKINKPQTEVTQQKLDKIKKSNTFKNNESVDVIKWFGSDTQIVYLIDQLIEKNFLSLTLDIHATINKHFVDENGNPFKNLKQAKFNYQNNKTRKPKRGDEIDDIIDNLTE